MTRALARFLGPQATVYGLDVSPEHILYARQMAEGEGLTNVRYLVGDLFASLDELPVGFDLVCEKYVLMYKVPKKQGLAFISEMKRRARPGGKIVCIEADINFGQERYPPPSESLSRLLTQIVHYYREQELIEWRCGVQLYHHMSMAGLSDLNIDLVDSRTIAGGFPEQLVRHDNEDVEELIRPCMERLDIPESIDEMARQWREYLSSPDSFLYTPIFMGMGTVDQPAVA